MHSLWRYFAMRVLSDFVTAFVFLAVFGIIFYRRRLPEWLRSLRAESWRIAHGTVETGDVTAMRAAIDGNFQLLRAPELAKASLGYSYQVDGVFYSGYYSKAFTDEQEAWDFVYAWKGQTVQVRFHPDKPKVSVMQLNERSCSPEMALLH